MPSYYVGFTATPKSLTVVKFKEKWRNTIYLLTTEYRTANLDDVIGLGTRVCIPLSMTLSLIIISVSARYVCATYFLSFSL